MGKKYSFDAHEIRRRMPYDPDAAAEAMRFIARCAKIGVPIPSPLDEYLAEAFVAAADADSKEREKVLRHALGLRVRNRRPVGHAWDIGELRRVDVTCAIER